jgi:hypothetical protein
MTRTEVLQIRLSTEEKKEIQRHAEIAGMKPAPYVRSMALHRLAELDGIDEQVQAKREDPEFMARIKKTVEEHQPVLDRLAQNDGIPDAAPTVPPRDPLPPRQTEAEEIESFKKPDLEADGSPATVDPDDIAASRRYELLVAKNKLKMGTKAAERKAREELGIDA